MPLVFQPGDAFQFDWSEDWAYVGGERIKLQVAHIKLSHSRALLIRAYLLQTHELLSEPPPGLPEAISFKLCGHGWGVHHGVGSFVGFRGRDVSDWLQQATVVEPVPPLQGGAFDAIDVAPWSAPVNDLGRAAFVDVRPRVRCLLRPIAQCILSTDIALHDPSGEPPPRWMRRRT